MANMTLWTLTYELADRRRRATDTDEALAKEVMAQWGRYLAKAGRSTVGTVDIRRVADGVWEAQGYAVLHPDAIAVVHRMELLPGGDALGPAGDKQRAEDEWRAVAAAQGREQAGALHTTWEESDDVRVWGTWEVVGLARPHGSHWVSGGDA